MDLGSPMVIFLAQERSTPPFIPKATQFGTGGLQIQQPNELYPCLHLGYAISPDI